MSLIFKRYKVISGIFEGLIFIGHPATISGEPRIVNIGTVGQSYPTLNCIEIKEGE